MSYSERFARPINNSYGQNFGSRSLFRFTTHRLERRRGGCKQKYCPMREHNWQGKTEREGRKNCNGMVWWDDAQVSRDSNHTGFNRDQSLSSWGKHNTTGLVMWIPRDPFWERGTPESKGKDHFPPWDVPRWWWKVMWINTWPFSTLVIGLVNNLHIWSISYRPLINFEKEEPGKYRK